MVCILLWKSGYKCYVGLSTSWENPYFQTFVFKTMGCRLIPPTFTIDTHTKKEIKFWWGYRSFCGFCELLSKSTALLLFQASNIWTVSCCFFATLYLPGLKIVCMTEPLEIMNLQRRFCARAISLINLTMNFSGSQGNTVGQFAPAFKGDCSPCPGDQNLSFHSFL